MLQSGPAVEGFTTPEDLVKIGLLRAQIKQLFSIALWRWQPERCIFKLPRNGDSCKETFWV